METQEESPIVVPTTLHQIWLGDEIPYESMVRFVDKTEEVCKKSGITYRLWRIGDLLSITPYNKVSYIWKKLLTYTPYPIIFSAAVDYFKWKILSLTPQEEIGLFLDLDVELSPGENGRLDLPYPEAYITFGLGLDGASPTSSFLHVYGSTAAKVAVDEADRVFLPVDIDSPTFFTDFLQGSERDKGALSLRGEWLREKLIPALAEKEYLSEIAPQEIFSHLGNNTTPIFLHHESHFVYDGKRMVNEIGEYTKWTEEEVKKDQERYNEETKKVILLMSTAKDYDESLHRTLGLITAENIRDIQRNTTLKRTRKDFKSSDYYFIVGKGGKELGAEEKDSPEFYFAPDEEGKVNLALRFYHAMRWAFDHTRFNFLFFCEDDNYIHLSRLLSFVQTLSSSEGKVYGHTDGEGKATQAGILVPISVIRHIFLLNLDPPKQGEDFGVWVKRALEVVGGEFVEDDKFSYTKGQYPSPMNGRITTHEVNPFDLVLLDAGNDT